MSHTEDVTMEDKICLDKLNEVVGGYAIRKADGEYFLLNTKGGVSIASVHATAMEACAARDRILKRR